MNWYVDVLKNYALFTGRARRKEYWMFFLFNIVISIGISIVATLIKVPLLSTIYSLAILCPAIAVGIRRMHDTGRSGWWIIVPIANLIFACTDSQPGSNEYGPNPKMA
jgi:uncharacterized membrane protein YhaH (DUF805 family)